MGSGDRKPTRVAERTRVWAAWTGEIADLERLGREVEKVHEKRTDAILREYDEATAEVLSGITDDQILREIRQKSRAERREELASDLRLQMTIVEGTDTITGSIEGVLGEVDRRSTSEICFSNRLRYGSSDLLSVKLRRDRSHKAAELHIKSEDPGWAREAFVHLSEQIDKGYPRWGWICSGRGEVLFVLFNTLCLMALVALLAWPPSPVRLFGPDKIGAPILWGVICGLISFFLSPKLLNWMFPSFEITGPGGQSKGGRYVAYIGSLVAAFVIDIIVTIIS
jgi:hypothetical protein